MAPLEAQWVVVIAVSTQAPPDKKTRGGTPLSFAYVWQFVLLVWGLTLVFISDIGGLAIWGDVPRPPPKDVAVSSLMRVSVYYEALCPDSRHFISHQLLPAYDAFSDVIIVDLIPYGKATSHVSQDGKKTFHCQHGPPECQANLVHACVVKHLSSQRRRLDAVRCMIEANAPDIDPLQVGRKCMAEYKDADWAAIEKCSKSSEGEGLLYHLGKMTHDLSPQITFIPSITIDGSQKNQQLILRNLKKAICAVYSGPKHSACDT